MLSTQLIIWYQITKPQELGSDLLSTLAVLSQVTLSFDSNVLGIAYFLLQG